MNHFRRRIRQAVGELLYCLGRKYPKEQSLSVLMYHTITESPLNDVTQASVPVELFEKQMRALHQMGIEVVHLQEGIRRLKKGTQTEPTVSVVFDDGYIGVHDYALAILRRYRIPSTLFLATRWMGELTFPWAPRSLGRPMTWEEISYLTQNTDMEVGSHTHNHLILADINPSQMRQEIQLSCQVIKENLHLIPTSFAYPYGAYGTFNDETRRILKEEGFLVGCINVWGRFFPGDDPLNVKRMRVSWCDGPHEIKKSLAGCYDWYRLFQHRWCHKPL